MKRIFIGHRGVGKSALLQRHKEYISGIEHFDLDEEIQKLIEPKTISDFFAENGESKFRSLEKETFNTLIRKHENYVIAVGAGFSVAELPGQAEIIWVRRKSDKNGRIFMNRPALIPELSPLDEFYKKTEEREPLFLAKANFIYDMPEGLNAVDSIEESIFNGHCRITDAYYTLSSQDLKNPEKVLKIFKKIELRTDLLREESIDELVSSNLNQHWLVSVRGPSKLDLKYLKSINKNIQIDTDFYFFSDEADIVSSHIDCILDSIAQLNKHAENKCLKLCPIVHNFDELQTGIKWQQESPKTRSFLPRSPDGKWLWCRQAAKYNQQLNFIRNFTQSEDQPSLYEWCVLPKEKPSSWAAVIGHPVNHSFSPIYHRQFFAKRNTYFTAIDIRKNENIEAVLNFLFNMGLRYVAVTAPLKEIVSGIVSNGDTPGAINTIYFSNKKINFKNTDIDGFAALTANIDTAKTIAVWGGGGTLELMQKMLPQADFFSSRTGILRSGKVNNTKYDFLIWAAPRIVDMKFPADEISVLNVIDLNYAQSSAGLEFARSRKINYTSGLEMFKVQAENQQKFWSECERQ